MSGNSACPSCQSLPPKPGRGRTGGGAAARNQNRGSCQSGQTSARARCIRRCTPPSHLIEDHAAAAGYPARFAASKLIEGDAPLEEVLELDESDKDILQHIIDQMEEGTGTDREAALADMRYQFIEQLYDDCVSQKSGTREMQRSIKSIKCLPIKSGRSRFLGNYGVHFLPDVRCHRRAFYRAHSRRGSLL